MGIDVFYNLFTTMWGGEKANAKAPDYVEFFGQVLIAGDGFYDRFYTLDGIKKQLEDFGRDIGLIYYFDSEKNQVISEPISLNGIGYESKK